MPEIQTLQDLIHAVTNSLSIMSSHSQYLFGKLDSADPGRDELKLISDEAERVARLLALVPQSFAERSIQMATSTDGQPLE